MRRFLIITAFLLVSLPCFARTTVVYQRPLTSSGGGSSPTGSVFVSSGNFDNFNGLTVGTFGFPTLPTSGNLMILPLFFSGTSLPTTVTDQNLTSLVISTSIVDATGGMGTAVYYLQSLSTTGSTTTVIVTFAGSTQFSGTLVQANNQNSSALDVSTGGVRASLTIASTSPVTAATTQLGVAAYVCNASNPGQSYTPPGGWTNIGQVTDGSTNEAGFVYFKSSTTLESVAVGMQATSGSTGNRSTQSVSFFK